MKPSSSNPEKQNSVEVDSNPAAPDESTSLTRRELLGTLCFGLAITGLAMGIAFLASKREKSAAAPSKLDHPRQLVAFNLTERSGRTVTRDDVAGKILVVNFVFTSCSLSCRAVNDRMEEIQGFVADATDVLLVSLTVDPRTDTPHVLAKFADSFHADTNRWLFLTGNKPELYGLIETSFIPKSEEFADLIPGGFTSTDRIMLVDQKGNVTASFNGLRQSVASSVITEIERLRKAHKPK